MTVIIQGGYDAARLGTLTVTITETGGGGLVKTATLAAQYMPSRAIGAGLLVMTDYGTDSTPSAATYYVSALAALQSAFNTGLTSVITVSINAVGKWVFTSNGAGGVTSIAVTFNAQAQKYFGAGSGVYSGALTYTMIWYAVLYMLPAQSGLQGIVDPHEVSDSLAQDLMANDGTTEGMTLPGAVYEMECIVPIEPAARVWHVRGFGGNDGTWESFFRLVRNIEPITIDTGTKIYVAKLKADSCHFAPELLSADYLAYANVPLRCHYLGAL